MGGGRETSQPAKRKARAKACLSHRCEVNTLGILACNFSMSFKSLTESERNDRFLPEKFLKVIKYVSYSIKYCKISLLI